jgi:hypothetical protein
MAEMRNAYNASVGLHEGKRSRERLALGADRRITLTLVSQKQHMNQ